MSVGMKWESFEMNLDKLAEVYVIDENEQQKDLCITVEKQVWESTLHRSMVLQAENDKLKELVKECFEYIDWTDGTGSPISQQKLLDKIDEALR